MTKQLIPAVATVQSIGVGTAVQHIVPGITRQGIQSIGEQQVRNIWSNIGCWHLNQWMYTLVELCSWGVAKPQLTNRSNRPWDNPDCRPSHADRRSKIAREMLGKQFLAALPNTLNLRKFKTLIKDVISLCT